MRKPIGTIKDPMYTNQWNLRLMRINEAWPFGMGKEVEVGVIDSGVDGSHKDLGWETAIHMSSIDTPDVTERKYSPVMEAIEAEEHPKILPGWNFVDDNPFTWDWYRHGTYLTGAIGAKRNDFGMIGVAPLCKIRPYVVIKPNGRWVGSDKVAEAIIKAYTDGCHIINMSLAWYRHYPEIAEAIEMVSDDGVIVIAATGNRNSKGIAYPAAYDDTIAVGGCGPKGDRWTHNAWRGSSYGDGIDCVAPGAAQMTTRKMRSRFTNIDGTSMACANLSGLVALLKGMRPSLTTHGMKSFIENHCMFTEWSEDVGYGVPDAFKMAQAASGELNGSAIIKETQERLNQIAIQLTHISESLGGLV